MLIDFLSLLALGQGEMFWMDTSGQCHVWLKGKILGVRKSNWQDSDDFRSCSECGLLDGMIHVERLHELYAKNT